MKVKRAHGVNCVYLPPWLSDQFVMGQHVIILVKGRKVVGRISRNGERKIIILPHFVEEGEEVTHVVTHVGG